MALVVKLQHVVDEMDTLSDELHAYLNLFHMKSARGK